VNLVLGLPRFFNRDVEGNFQNVALATKKL